MTLLTTKIAELTDEILSSQEDVLIWRGNLDTQTWKIIIHRDQRKTYQLFIKVERRDGFDGDPV